MPTYEYLCEGCKYSFEKFQSIKAKPVRKCPRCGSLKVKRLLGTGAGIIFRGSGFYQTDYRSESFKKAQQNECKGTSDTSGKPASETKDKKSPNTEKPKPTDSKNNSNK